MLDRLLRIFRGSDKPSEWETMPRIGKSFSEHQEENFRKMFGDVDVSKVHRAEVIILADDLASNACAPEVPTFYALQGQVYCFFKTGSVSDDIGASLAKSIDDGRTMLIARYKSLRTYPVVALLLEIPTDDGPIRLEAVPDIASADIRDSLDILVAVGKGYFHFYVGEPPQLLAKGEFSVSPKDLRQCLEQAAARYKKIDPRELNYMAAMQEYFATTSL